MYNFELVLLKWVLNCLSQLVGFSLKNIPKFFPSLYIWYLEMHIVLHLDGLTSFAICLASIPDQVNQLGVYYSLPH